MNYTLIRIGTQQSEVESIDYELQADTLTEVLREFRKFENDSDEFHIVITEDFENGSYDYLESNPIKELRRRTGKNISKFSSMLNIPYRTIQNWESGERKCPDYLVELIEYRLTH